MDTKIIFFDIDGTILSEKTGIITDDTKSAIMQARSKGHLVFINTGRTIAEINKEVEEIGFDGYVCGCGTYISKGNTVLFHKEIPSKLCHAILEDILTFKLEAVLEGSNAVYYNPNLALPKLLKQRNDHREVQHFNVQDWNAPELSFDKFCIWPAAEEDYNRFYEKYKETFDFIKRGDFAEVIPKGYSKAFGIAFLLSQLDIPLKNTYALGDSDNDLAMLGYVSNSVAMGNSAKEIKDAVSFVTLDVDEGGVAYALKHFGLI